jgi:hypothetical protein
LTPRKEARMDVRVECPKCQGLMVRERFSDSAVSFDAWKCVNCGAILDPVIIQNRRSNTPATPKAAPVGR